ncbi:MAG: tryptophan--tRNA ligase [Candidatus Paceibacteria bacterium]
MAEKRLLTGIKPSGSVHLGNYLGAVKPFLQQQQEEQFDQTFLFVANYHALTQRMEGETLQQLTERIVLDYLAMGLDPERTVLFLQSDVPEVTELTWILNNFISVSRLERAHAYKDAIANGKEPNTGLFDYPVLMAADILLYQSTHVPVGQDQKQHLEITRDLAHEVNYVCNREVLTVPEPRISEHTGTLSGIDGRKMSKSYDNTIEVFSDEKTLKKQVMSIVTDSKRPEEPKDPEECNIFALHKHITSESELREIEKGYREGGLSYKESKQRLFESLKDFLQPFWKKREELEKNPHIVREVLKSGADKARTTAEHTLKDVRDELGLISYKYF